MKNTFITRYYSVLCQLSLIETYDSIKDTPAYIWFEINEHKNFNLLVKSDIKHKHLFPTSYLLPHWENLYSDFISSFPPVKYLEEIELRYKIAKLRFEAAAFNQQHKETIADLKELELQDKEEIQKTDFYLNVGLMQKQLGFKINPHKITIFEYYNNLKALSNGSK